MTQSTGTRARTRQAILEAAIAVLAHYPNASLGDIAVAADVGRTTLHRYFAERSDLLTAVSGEITARLDQAMANAGPETGTGGSALLRLCAEYFQLGSVLSLIFGEPYVHTEQSTGEVGCDPRFAAIVERGHRDGTIDPALPAGWLQSMLWAQLYGAWAYATESGAARHVVLDLLVRTIDGAISGK